MTLREFEGKYEVPYQHLLEAMQSKGGKKDGRKIRNWQYSETELIIKTLNFYRQKAGGHEKMFNHYKKYYQGILKIMNAEKEEREKGGNGGENGGGNGAGTGDGQGLRDEGSTAGQGGDGAGNSAASTGGKPTAE